MAGDTVRSDDARHVWRSFWRCFALCLAAVLAVTLAFRLPGWLLLALLLLACPIAGIWAYLQSCRPLPVPLGPSSQTHGPTLNWLAPWYDGVCRHLGLGHAFHVKTIELAGIRSGEHVLDIGCRTGALACLAARVAGPSGRVRGIDASPDMVRIAREKAACIGARPRIDLASAETLPFPDAEFDVVLASMALDRLPSPALQAALQEIRRALKPEGRFIVVAVDQPAGLLARLFTVLLSVGLGLRRRSQGRMEEILRQAGFRIVRIGTWGRLIGIWRAEPISAESRPIGS
ncbi:class I SAM-dependent methyltransferase [Sphingopyxis chilensis]